MKSKFCVYQAYKEADDMRHIPGQDKGCVVRKDKVIALALCDGAGSVLNAAVGAQEMALTIANVLCDNWERYQQVFPDVIRREIYIKIRRKLEALSNQYQCEKEEFASTIIAFATDGKQCIGIHLGDGEIVSNDSDGIYVLSYPVNGVNPDSTYLTTSKCAYKKIRVYRFLRTHTKYMLCTDGVDWRDIDNLGKLFELGNETDICNILKHKGIGDDASVIKLEIY